MKKLHLVIGFVFFSFITHAAVYAQDQHPSGQFGVGVYSVRSSLPSGLEGVYALTSSFQIGAEVSLGVTSTGSSTTTIPNGTGGFTTVSTGSTSTTAFYAAPFARLLFGTGNVNPFIQGAVQILSNGTTNVGIFFGGGVAYHINKELALQAGIDIVNAMFSTPSTISFGWSIIRADGDWYF
ncbi:MAG TPA: hypothetical protein VGM92_09900 [Candidatus Kapabacteria bacterium]|jgi:hypothetical protein